VTARRRVLAAIAVVALAAAACTGDGVTLTFGSPSPSPTEGGPGPATSSDGRVLRVDPVRTGKASSAAAMKQLCISPTSVSTSDGKPPADTPASIEEVEDQVEAVRGLDYLKPVAAEPVTAERIADELTSAFDETYPKAFYDRRTVAWQTIGVIPDDVTIRDALLAFQTGGVVGFYNPVDGELVYIGDDDLDLTERYTLAHELTHAIDDQHFDLSRLDRFTRTCQDESFQAALGAVEGSAQLFAAKVLLAFPDPDAEIGGGGGGLPEGVPPFMVETLLYPYSTGQSFMTALEERGGLGAVDGALARLPATTEQVIHPERYPSDAPVDIDVPDLSRPLGRGWGDLDVMVVGELWLRAMLALHLEAGTADAAAAGWDGGTYRAWTDGRDSAVMLATAWDTTADAEEFAAAMTEWLTRSGDLGFVAEPDGARVEVGFATSEAALDVLRAATAD
jgi:hypothetical protein